MYTPSHEILEKYANVLINFALRGGKGIKKGDTVFIQIPECAKPFLIPLQMAILKAGGYPVIQYLPDGIARNFYENASDEQLSFVPEEYQKGKIESMTHLVRIISDADLHELDGIDPHKIMKKTQANGKFRYLRDKKESEGKFSRVGCLYGTEAMAKEAGLSLEEYWNQIIDACFLNEPDPVKKWEEVYSEMYRVRDKLNELKLEYVHVIGPDEDLKVKIGTDRLWQTGGGCNIPSFEVFTSPDCRDVNGRIKCNQPLYRYGSLVEGIKLEFKDGKVVKVTADKNEDILHEMVKIEGMDHLGEFSLTDARISRITHFMAETLFDENIGGEYGNTHVALGLGFDECYAGDKSKLDDPEYKKSIGLNYSAEHVDVISTAKRKVIGTLSNGDEILIYEDGKFMI